MTVRGDDEKEGRQIHVGQCKPLLKYFPAGREKAGSVRTEGQTEWVSYLGGEGFGKARDTYTLPKACVPDNEKRGGESIRQPGPTIPDVVSP